MQHMGYCLSRTRALSSVLGLRNAASVRPSAPALRPADWPVVLALPKPFGCFQRAPIKASRRHHYYPILIFLSTTTLAHCAAAPLDLSPPTLVPLRFAAMFKQLIPRASTRGALSSGFQSAQALRSTAPSTTLLQQRIWQRRGYATETGMIFPG